MMFDAIRPEQNLYPLYLIPTPVKQASSSSGSTKRLLAGLTHRREKTSKQPFLDSISLRNEQLSKKQLTSGTTKRRRDGESLNSMSWSVSSLARTGGVGFWKKRESRGDNATEMRSQKQFIQISRKRRGKMKQPHGHSKIRELGLSIGQKNPMLYSKKNEYLLNW